MRPSTSSVPHGKAAAGAPASILLGVALVCIGFQYWDGLTDMVQAWSRDEYSHGYIIPFVAAYLLMRRLPLAVEVPSEHSWAGPLVAVVAIALGTVGNFSQIADITQYGFILALLALLLACLGLRSTLILWASLAYLLFMVPLPQVLYLKLSSALQLLSSELGVAFIRLMNISVLLEGNVIDLGVYKLQVVEACSGLRYLFPLMSFGFLFAVLYRGPQWHRLILFLSTIPITILMNSFRIGMIGALVESYGIEPAEGFLHFFEGWVIFITCIIAIFIVALILARLSGSRLPLHEILDLRSDHISGLSIGWPVIRDVRALAGTTAVLLFGVIALQVEIDEMSSPPGRQAFAIFPSAFDDWHGRQTALDPEILDVLAADDYIRSSYARAEDPAPINLFIAYYENQTDGRAVHSPEVCIPGGGWEIGEFRSVELDLDGDAAPGFRVNRAIVQKGTNRQLVYYWFEQRGRQLTNEYVVKWYILWDALTRNRTDGSLVRLITPISNKDGEAAADKRLTDYLGRIYPVLPQFLPK